MTGCESGRPYGIHRPAGPIAETCQHFDRHFKFSEVEFDTIYSLNLRMLQLTLLNSRWCCRCYKLSDLSALFAGDNGQYVVKDVLTVACFCVCAEGRSGFAAAEDDEWSPALKLDGVGMMDLPNGQSGITTTAATVSEVRPHPLTPRPPPTLFQKFILCMFLPEIDTTEIFSQHIFFFFLVIHCVWLFIQTSQTLHTSPLFSTW